MFPNAKTPNDLLVAHNVPKNEIPTSINSFSAAGLCHRGWTIVKDGNLWDVPFITKEFFDSYLTHNPRKDSWQHCNDWNYVLWLIGQENNRSAGKKYMYKFTDSKIPFTFHRMIYMLTLMRSTP